MNEPLIPPEDRLEPPERFPGSPEPWIAAEPWEDRTLNRFDLSLKVLPDELFSDEYSPATDVPKDERGPKSYTIRGRLISSCAGWPVKPTEEESYHAFRQAEPDERQQAITHVLVQEGDVHEWCNAWYEGAFTWRQLARVIRRGLPWSPRTIRRINRMRVWRTT